MCLSLAPHVLIASAPRAYRSWPSSLSLAGRLLIARGVIDNAKVLHLGRALSDFVRFHRFFSLTSYILHLTSLSSSHDLRMMSRLGSALA